MLHGFEDKGTSAIAQHLEASVSCLRAEVNGILYDRMSAPNVRSPLIAEY